MKPNLPRPGLQIKIVAWSFVPSAIILLGIALSSLYLLQVVVEALMIENNRGTTERMAEQIGGELLTFTGPLKDVARDPDLLGGDVTAQRAALRRAVPRLPVFDAGVVVLNPEGIVVAAEPSREDSPPEDWSDRPYFRRMAHSPATVWSDVHTDNPRNTLVVSLAVPITGPDGRFHGAVAGMFRADSTSSEFHRRLAAFRTWVADTEPDLVNSGPVKSTFLVDHTGRIVAHTEATLVGEDVSAQSAVQAVIAGRRGPISTAEYRDRQVVTYFAPVPNTGWGLLVEQERSAVLYFYQRYFQLQSFLFALALIIPAGLVAFGARHITGPIRQVTAASRQIAAGDLRQVIDVRTGDELEELAKQFNRMSAQLDADITRRKQAEEALRTSESNLQGAYQTLEHRVQERTRQLAVLNSIAAVVSRSLELEEIMHDALAQTIRFYGMDSGAAYELEEHSRSLVLIADEGFSDDHAQRISRLPLQVALEGKLQFTGQPVVWQVAQDYPEGELKQSFLERGIQSIFAVALTAKGKPVGAFTVGSKTPRELTLEESALLAAVGQQVGVAVENARLYRQAQQTATTAERSRLARELHDSVTQSLYSVMLYAEAAVRSLADREIPEAGDYLKELRDTAQSALREMRLLIFELRPPALEKDGLVAALRTRLNAVEGRGGMKTALCIDNHWRTGELPIALEEELYHITQEALNNVIRHAHARSVTVRLVFSDGAIDLEIADDGIGFDPEDAGQSSGMGLSGMRERVQRIGGSIRIKSAAGTGTRVTVHVPGVSRARDNTVAGGAR